MRQIACCIVADFPDEWALLHAEIQENTCRKPFNPSEAVSNAERLLPQAAAAARTRMARTYEKFSEVVQAMDQVARVVGRTHPTLAKAMKVVEAARIDPRKFEYLILKMDRTGKVSPASTRSTRSTRSTTPRSSDPSLKKSPQENFLTCPYLRAEQRNYPTAPINPI